MQNAILDYWPQILAGIAFIAWLVRLETKVSTNESFNSKIEKMAEDIVEIKTNIKWIKESKPA